MAAARVHLVLASASPARRATLRAAGVEPTVMVSDVDEAATMAAAAERRHVRNLAPADAALLLARAKCEAVAAQLTTSAVVLGCDSLLELDGVAYGKPTDVEDARNAWRRMRSRTGMLHTGHWLRDQRSSGDGGRAANLGATSSTAVHFGDLTDDEIDAYVATGEPLRVAGAFTVDGLGGPFVDGVEGDYHNVVGLSLPLLRRLLTQIDVTWFQLVEGHGK